MVSANNPAVAVGCFFQGLAWLARPELRGFLLVPVAANLVLYGAALLLGYHYLGVVIAQFIPAGWEWLGWLLWPLFTVGFFIVGFFTFTMMANLIAAPFYGQLAARTWAMLDARGGRAGGPVVEPPMAKMLAAQFRRARYFAGRGLLLSLLFVVPVVNLLLPLLWMLFGAWAVAMDYLSYPLENQGVLFAEQRRLVGPARLGLLAFGAVTMLGLLVPVLNLVVAPAAVIGATLYVHGHGGSLGLVAGER